MAYSARADRRQPLGRLLISGVLCASIAATCAPVRAGVAHMPARMPARDAYDDLGYDNGYGGDYDPSASFTYDPGGVCYGVTCDGGFSDPATNYMYDASQAAESATDASVDAFDAYIREQPAPVGAYAASGGIGGPSGFGAVGRVLTGLIGTGVSAAAEHTGQAPLSLQEARRLLPISVARAAADSTAIPADGGATAVFVDKQRTYKINYPGDWTMVDHDRSVRGAYVDARLIAPSANAGVVGQSTTLPAGMAFNLRDPNVQRYLAGSIQFAAFGARAMQQPELQTFSIPSGDDLLVGRVPFEWVDSSLAPSQFTDVTDGMQGAVLFAALRHNDRLYVITGTIADVTADSAPQDAQHLSAILSSLAVFHIYKPAGKPNAIVDATATYRLAFPSTWTYTKGMPSGDTALVSKDRTTAVVALASPAPHGMGQISAGYMRTVVSGLGSTLGTLTGAPTFHKVVVRGNTRYAATLRFRRKDGKTGRAMVVATLHRAKVCAAVGIAMDHGPTSIQQQAQQASYIVSSLHLL